MPLLTQDQKDCIIVNLGYSDAPQLIQAKLDEEYLQKTIDRVDAILLKLEGIEVKIETAAEKDSIKRVDEIEFKGNRESKLRELASNCLYELAHLLGLQIQFDRFNPKGGSKASICSYGGGAHGGSRVYPPNQHHTVYRHHLTSHRYY